MKCFEIFKNKMMRSGRDLREERIIDSRNFLRETFYDDPSYCDYIYLWELGKLDYSNDKSIPIRIYARSHSAAVGTTAKFVTMHDTIINIGDVLYNRKDNSYYICTESFDLDGINNKGKLTLCNWILKWQDSKGNILEYPCYIINSTQYNSGETFYKYYTTGTAQHLITLPHDENTVVLNTPRRFFLDRNFQNPTAYIITQNDTTSYNYGKKGLVKITVVQYETDYSKDRIDLGICDYIPEDKVKDDDNKSKRSVIECEEPIIKAGGDAQVFKGKFLDENNNEVLGITPKWSVICPFKDVLNIKEVGNEIQISIEDEEHIDDEFKLVFSDEYGDYSSTLLIRIDSLL